jgi:hypothetical protein
MKKPEFEQFRHALLRRAQPLPQQQREPYKAAIVSLLDDSGMFLVQKSRKDGHDDALIEVHCSWVGTDFSPDHVIQTLRELWPGAIFEKGEKKHWIEAEDEVVVLEFAWENGGGQFVTGRIKVTV